jgi:hypothetical protein
MPWAGYLNTETSEGWPVLLVGLAAVPLISTASLPPAGCAWDATVTVTKGSTGICAECRTCLAGPV